MGVRRVLLLTDRGVRRAGVVDGIAGAVESLGIDVTWFDEIEPNPRDSTVERAAGVAQEVAAGGLVAVGGGSVMDAAKAAGILVTSGGRLRDYEGRGRVSRPIPPLVAVPTTAGTGSEVTFSSVITDTARRYKFSINSPLATARLAVLDPALTVSMPAPITASTGMDALTHAIEALTSTKANPISNALALSAIQLIAKHLVTATRDGENLEARSGMLMGSLLAGMAFANADVAGVHCMAEALGGVYDTPHGVANSIFLPYVMEFNLPSSAEKLALVASSMGETVTGLSVPEAAMRSVEAVRALSVDLDIPRFGDLGIDSSGFDDLARLAAANGSAGSNPRPVSEEVFGDLFRRALRDS
jgi:alcohol dehydrogenase